MLVTIGILICSITALWLILRKPSSYPPGNWGLPYIGHLSLSKKNLEEQLLEIYRRNEECPLISWRMGNQLVVFVFDWQLLKEAFSDNIFVGRPKMRILGYVGGSNYGVVTSMGNSWKNTRRFTLHHLRNLGMGKSSFVSIIQKEAQNMVSVMKTQAGNPAPLPSLAIVKASVNVIWKMVADRNYSEEDENLVDFQSKLDDLRVNMDSITMVDFMPWLAKLLPSSLFRKFFPCDEAVDNIKENVLKLVKEDLNSHLKKKEEKKEDEEEVYDYINAYLSEIDKNRDNAESTFSREDLIITISDLFGAGIETVSTTLIWTFYYLASNPQVQTKLQEEIDDVLPKGTFATLDDKPYLPYTEAVYYEVLRHTSLHRLGVMHTAVENTLLAGYKIPKDTIVTPAMFWLNHSPKLWETPEEFRPERFIDENGKLFLPPHFFPFGVGKRVCLGESLSRMELLVFISAMAQNVSFSIPEGKTLDMAPMPTTIFAMPKLKQDIIATVR